MTAAHIQDYDEEYINQYIGGPITIMPDYDGNHWPDLWSQQCSRCGEFMDDIVNLHMPCRPADPDYLAATREVVPKCR